MPNVDPNKTVFISYRRSVSRYIARSIFENLRHHDYDVFLDVETIDSGDWETIILNQIAARAHFLIILTPGTLDRCSEANDMLRREIVRAMELGRNIVPVLIDEFHFGMAEAHLTGKLATLPKYNAMRLPYDFFDETMDRLRSRFLKPPTALPSLQPTPAKEEARVEQAIEAVVNEPQPTPHQLSAEQLFARALGKKNIGEWDSAIADYTEAIRLNPNYTVAYNNRGNARYQQGDVEGAIEDYDKAIAINPDYATAYYNRGFARSSQGDLQGAIADYDKAIAINPNDAEAYYNRGNARSSQGDLQGAIADYNKAIAINPNDAEAYNNRAEIYFALKQNEKALIDFRKAIELEPSHFIILGGLAITHHALGDADEARRLWMGLVEQDERYKDAEWVRQELNWAEPLLKAAQQLISEL